MGARGGHKYSEVPATPEDAPAAILDAPGNIASAAPGIDVDARAGIIAAFNRPRAQAAPAPRQPQRQDERPWFAGGQQKPEWLSEEAVDEHLAGWRAGNIAWPRRLLGPAPGEDGCRLTRAQLRRNGL